MNIGRRDANCNNKLYDILSDLLKNPEVERFTIPTYISRSRYSNDNRAVTDVYHSNVCSTNAILGQISRCHKSDEMLIKLLRVCLDLILSDESDDDIIVKTDRVLRHIKNINEGIRKYIAINIQKSSTLTLGMSSTDISYLGANEKGLFFILTNNTSCVKGNGGSIINKYLVYYNIKKGEIRHIEKLSKNIAAVESRYSYNSIGDIGMTDIMTLMPLLKKLDINITSGGLSVSIGNRSEMIKPINISEMTAESIDINIILNDNTIAYIPTSINIFIDESLLDLESLQSSMSITINPLTKHITYSDGSEESDSKLNSMSEFLSKEDVTHYDLMKLLVESNPIKKKAKLEDGADYGRL